VVFAILGSALSRYAHLDSGPIAPVTSFLTILVGVAAIFGSRFYRLWPVLLLGTTAELVGLYTGFPFGHYRYTDQWAPVITLPQGFQFPVILPFAWLLMAGAAWAIAPGTGWQKAITAGAIAALIDLPMEAVMTGPLRYWTWNPTGPLPGGAPVTNTIGWFAVATAAGLLLNLCQPPGNSETGSAGRGPTTGSAAWVLGGFFVLTVALGAIRG